MVENYQRFEEIGGESFSDDEYVGVFKTMEGFGSILYLNRWGQLSAIEKAAIKSLKDEFDKEIIASTFS